MKRIYIGNMNFSTSEESIKNLFSKYGTVDSVEIIKDKYTLPYCHIRFMIATSLL